MIQFGHNLIDQYCWNLLLANGLNPLIGVFYSDNQRQTAPLALDVAIEYRFLAEQIILKLINRKQITLSDFSDNTLPLAVRRLITADFSRKMQEKITIPLTGSKCEYQDALQFQMNQLKLFYTDERKDYIPMLLR
jgi:CRISPR/Cas system-associated endonuclease Cas1